MKKVALILLVSMLITILSACGDAPITDPKTEITAEEENYYIEDGFLYSGTPSYYDEYSPEDDVTYGRVKYTDVKKIMDSPVNSVLRTSDFAYIIIDGHQLAKYYPKTGTHEIIYTDKDYMDDLRGDKDIVYFIKNKSLYCLHDTSSIADLIVENITEIIDGYYMTEYRITPTRSIVFSVMPINYVPFRNAITNLFEQEYEWSIGCIEFCYDTQEQKYFIYSDMSYLHSRIKDFCKRYDIEEPQVSKSDNENEVPVFPDNYDEYFSQIIPFYSDRQTEFYYIIKENKIVNVEADGTVINTLYEGQKPLKDIYVNKHLVYFREDTEVKRIFLNGNIIDNLHNFENHEGFQIRAIANTVFEFAYFNDEYKKIVEMNDNDEVNINCKDWLMETYNLDASVFDKDYYRFNDFIRENIGIYEYTSGFYDAKNNILLFNKNDAEGNRIDPFIGTEYENILNMWS